MINSNKISNYLGQQSQANQYLMLEFQTQNCLKDPADNQTHDRKICTFYHDFHDERRFPFTEQGDFLYTIESCSELECPNFNRCRFYHNNYELLFHPLEFKRSPCQQFDSCQDNICPYFHKNEESRENIIQLYIGAMSASSSKYPSFAVTGPGVVGGVANGANQLKIPFALENQYNQELQYLHSEVMRIEKNKSEQKEFLLNFKTKPCLNKENHNLKHCIFYHNQQDMRRSYPNIPIFFNLCPVQDQCLDSEQCQYSHNKVEQLYHPDRYQSKYCEFYPDKIKDCEYGDLCSFAHQENEISIFLLDKLPKNQIFFIYFFQTVWCPLTQDHQRGQCPYAHNVQDYRRDPQIKCSIVAEDCQFWNQDRADLQQYQQGGCVMGLNCNLCHGWKELQYHPSIYKTQECNHQSKKQCCQKDCAYFHNFDQKRAPTKIISEDIPGINQEFLEKLSQIASQNGVPIDVFSNNFHQKKTNFRQKIIPVRAVHPPNIQYSQHNHAHEEIQYQYGRPERKNEDIGSMKTNNSTTPALSIESNSRGNSSDSTYTDHLPKQQKQSSGKRPQLNTKSIQFRLHSNPNSDDETIKNSQNKIKSAPPTPPSLLQNGYTDFNSKMSQAPNMFHHENLLQNSYMTGGYQQNYSENLNPHSSAWGKQGYVKNFDAFPTIVQSKYRFDPNENDNDEQYREIQDLIGKTVAPEDYVMNEKEIAKDQMNLESDGGFQSVQSDQYFQNF